MKRIAFLLALLLPVAAVAQTSTEWGVRVSAEANYRITKGLHVLAEEEFRYANGTTDNVRTTLGITYKPAKAVKFGLGYTLINPFSATTGAFKEPRHRFFADLSGNLQAGDFQFTLKERLQLTHRTGEFNVYQNTPNALALKSKFTVKYKRWTHVEPYLSFELRTALNDPWGTAGTTAQWNSKGTKSYYDYTPTGYTHVYNNRYRGELGAEIILSGHHSLKPYALFDFCNDYEMDTNSEGTRLFSAAYINTFRISAGLSYVFSF